MDKAQLLALIVRRLTEELASLRSAAMATHAEATSEENKAENKYDTRGLEASYLAHGQSKAAEDAAQALTQFQALSPRPFQAGEPISLGALVTIEGRTRQQYFLGPRAGGTEVTLDGESVMVVTPSSPLGRQLVGRTAGSTLQLELAGTRGSHRIAAVE